MKPESFGVVLFHLKWSQVYYFVLSIVLLRPSSFSVFDELCFAIVALPGYFHVHYYNHVLFASNMA